LMLAHLELAHLQALRLSLSTTSWQEKNSKSLLHQRSDNRKWHKEIYGKIFSTSYISLVPANRILKIITSAYPFL
jgi:hypothetical protein